MTHYLVASGRSRRFAFGTIAADGVDLGLRAGLKHGIVIMGAAFVAALTIENLLSYVLEVRIECSSKGMDVAGWIPHSDWERSACSGCVRMNADGFLVTIPEVIVGI